MKLRGFPYSTKGQFNPGTFKRFLRKEKLVFSTSGVKKGLLFDNN
jgi:hypothetical protein